MIINRPATLVQRVHYSEPPKTYVSKLSSVSREGQFVREMVREPVNMQDDVRTHMTSNDFSLGTLLATDGVAALKECPRFTEDPFDSIDKIDSTLETLNIDPNE